ncbi:MAG: hypothetical protein OJF52_002065 [Nitrospira sp.]|jgi:hypothetical protein|nr:MAG: hypothetical protein OJF52_002065 [Nitrospira sp.]
MERSERWEGKERAATRLEWFLTPFLLRECGRGFAVEATTFPREVFADGTSIVASTSSHSFLT